MGKSFSHGSTALIVLSDRCAERGWLFPVGSTGCAHPKQNGIPVMPRALDLVMIRRKLRENEKNAKPSEPVVCGSVAFSTSIPDWFHRGTMVPLPLNDTSSVACPSDSGGRVIPGRLETRQTIVIWTKFNTNERMCVLSLFLRDSALALSILGVDTVTNCVA
jgi:hypothetical protein